MRATITTQRGFEHGGGGGKMLQGECPVAPGTTKSEKGSGAPGSVHYGGKGKSMNYSKGDKSMKKGGY